MRKVYLSDSCTAKQAIDQLSHRGKTTNLPVYEGCEKFLHNNIFSEIVQVRSRFKILINETYKKHTLKGTNTV